MRTVSEIIANPLPGDFISKNATYLLGRSRNGLYWSACTRCGTYLWRQKADIDRVCQACRPELPMKPRLPVYRGEPAPPISIWRKGTPEYLADLAKASEKTNHTCCSL